MHIQLIEDLLDLLIEHFGGDIKLEEIGTLSMIDFLAVAGMKIVPDFQGEMSALAVQAWTEMAAAK